MFEFGAPVSRGHFVARGLIATALGIVCLVWPGITIGVAVVLFAIYCLADAATQIVRLFGPGDTAGQRIWALLLGALDVAAAIVAIADPGITAGVLVIVIGIWAIAAGATELAAAWSAGGAAFGWLTLDGIVSILAGVTLVVWPGIGAVTLAIVFGVYLLVDHVSSLAAAMIGAGGRADVAI
jgi:uncharacterized membrane protein HdeD (DUF308 family)